MAIQITLNTKVGDSWIKIPIVDGIGSATVNTAEELARFVDPFRYRIEDIGLLFKEQILGMILYDVEPRHYVIDKVQLPLSNTSEPLIFSLDIEVKKRTSIFIGLCSMQYPNGEYLVETVEVDNEADTSAKSYTELLEPNTIFCTKREINNESVNLNMEISPIPLHTNNSALALQTILIAKDKNIFSKLIEDNTADTEKFFIGYGLKGRFTMPIDLTEYEINYIVPSYLVDKPKSIKVVKGGSATFNLPNVDAPGIKAIGWEYNGKTYSQGKSITIENIRSNIIIKLVLEPKMSGIVVGQPIAT